MPELKDLTIIISSKADEIGINKTLNSILEVSPGELRLLLVLSDYQSEQVSRLSNQIQGWDAEIKLVPAKGIYRAQNTGLREAKTEFVMFINGGDELFSIQNLELLLRGMNGFDWGYGELLMVSSSYVKRTYSFQYKQLLHRLGVKFVPHPSTVLRRSTALDLGGYDETFESAADHKLLLEFSKLSRPFILNECVSTFYLGGVSTRSNVEIVRDCKLISQELFGNFFPNWRVEKTIWELNLLLRNITKLINRFS